MHLSIVLMFYIASVIASPTSIVMSTQAKTIPEEFDAFSVAISSYSDELSSWIAAYKAAATVISEIQKSGLQKASTKTPTVPCNLVLSSSHLTSSPSSMSSSVIPKPNPSTPLSVNPNPNPGISYITTESDGIWETVTSNNVTANITTMASPILNNTITSVGVETYNTYSGTAASITVMAGLTSQPSSQATTTSEASLTVTSYSTIETGASLSVSEGSSITSNTPKATNTGGATTRIAVSGLTILLIALASCILRMTA